MNPQVNSLSFENTVKFHLHILHVHGQVPSLLPVTHPNDLTFWFLQVYKYTPSAVTSSWQGTFTATNRPKAAVHFEPAPKVNANMVNEGFRDSISGPCTPYAPKNGAEDTSSLRDRTWGVRATAQTLRALFQCLIGWIVTGLSLHSRELITSMLQSLAFVSVPWQAECHLHPLDWPLCKLINSWSNYECFCTLCHDAPHQQQQRIGCVSVFSEACFLADMKDKASWCHWLNELSVWLSVRSVAGTSSLKTGTLFWSWICEGAYPCIT